MQWRVRPVLPVTKLIGACAVVVLAVAFGGGDRIRWVLAAVVAGLLLAWALRDVLVPVRLAADADGLTVVSGLARRRRLSWSQVERVRVDRTTRRGLRSELLEIDAGDAIYLFGAHELGAMPEDVAAELTGWRA
ncbi:PH domain-containing protein [Actinoplanes oblitus]|uniref:PH domain-containing protein n=1 Tax=Actinoplanes oblitus TaxID=3040509 RepID=A0ABY8WF13_9ACTN|nr:PH domain-containing protein [Actinoplanes oblitus]WIM96456.1 PH domain-containing protein [Actinoplanes oblitus]